MSSRKSNPLSVAQLVEEHRLQRRECLPARNSCQAERVCTVIPEASREKNDDYALDTEGCQEYILGMKLEHSEMIRDIELFAHDLANQAKSLPANDPQRSRLERMVEVLKQAASKLSAIASENV